MEKLSELFEKYAQDLDNPNITATKVKSNINIGNWKHKKGHRSNRLEKNKLQKLEKIKVGNGEFDTINQLLVPVSIYDNIQV